MRGGDSGVGKDDSGVVVVRVVIVALCTYAIRYNMIGLDWVRYDTI